MELNKTNLKKLLAQTSSLGDEVLEFADDQRFMAQGVDSLDLLDYLLRIEENFGVHIPDQDIEQVNTFDKLLAYLQAHKK